MIIAPQYIMLDLLVLALVGLVVNALWRIFRRF